MDIREMGWGGVDWIDLAVDREQWRALVPHTHIYYILIAFKNGGECSMPVHPMWDL
jgi:hypothetical protein